MKKNIVIYLIIAVVSISIVSNVYAKEQYYEIKEYNTRISLSSDYAVIIKNNDNSSIYDKLDLDEGEIENYMNALNAYLLATTPDLKKNIIITRKQDDGSERYYNMSELEDSIVESLADGYSQGFNTKDYSIEKANSITYVRLKYDLVSMQDEHLYYLKYKTIYNGYDYTIYIQKYSPITSDDEEELKGVIKTFKIEKIENPNPETKGYRTPIWIAILSGILITFLPIYKAKRNNRNKTTNNSKNNTEELIELPKCQSCGGDVRSDSKECPNCGALFVEENPDNIDDIDGIEENTESSEKVEETMEEQDDMFKCDNCGALVKESDTKCPNCGESFEDDEEEKSKTNMDQKYSDLNKLKKLLDDKIITKAEFDKEKKKILRD